MGRNIQQLPNNTYTAQTAEVYTSTGFNAGDLVYFQNNNYVGAPNLTGPSSAQFTNTQVFGTSNASNTGALGSVIGSTAAYTSAQGEGSSTLKSAALLTSGNIVQVYVATPSAIGPSGRTTSAVYFQIVNTSGVIQYGPTIVSSSILAGTSGAGVLALTGGGFVVYYSNSANNAVYGIYTNTGTVTTAVAADTGITTISASYINGTALANGGFALVALTTTPTVAFRAYGATGTATYAWTTTSAAPVSSTAAIPGIAARSDSSIAISFVSSTASTNYCYLYTSAGAAITNVSYTTSGNITTSEYPTDITCLADGTTYVIGYYNYNSTATAFYPAFRLLPTGNSLGSEIAIPYKNLQYYTTASTLNFISLQKQSAGGFMFAFTDTMGGIQYAFFNASGTALSGTNANGTLPILLPGYVGLCSILTMVEITGYMNLYWSVGTQGTASGSLVSVNQNFAQINETTYQPVPITSTTQTVGTVSSTAGVSVLSTITPTSSKFYAGSTTNITTTFSAGVTVGPTTVYNTRACYSVSACTLPNGQFLIAYMDSSTAVVYVAVYSVLGVLQQTITVGTSTGNGTLTNSIIIAALSSGKFVVAWLTPNNTNSVNLSLYSSSFTLINTTSVTLGATGGSSDNFALTGLAGTDNYAIAYLGTSGYPYYSVYNNANTIIGSTTLIHSAAAAWLSIAADNIGGFGISYITSGNQQVLYTYVPSSSTTWAATNTTGQAFPTVTYGPTYLTHSNNQYYGLANNGTNGCISAIYNSNTTYTPNNNTNIINTNFYGLGINGNGNIIAVSSSAATSGTTSVYSVLPGISTQASGSLLNAASSNVNTFITPTSSSSYGNFQYYIIPSYGNNVVIVWVDANGYPNFCIYNPTTYTTTTLVTSGVTQSNTISINPTANVTSNATAILAGVALTNASAGSTGQVQINGFATLNSNYTNTAAGAFDFTGQAIDGVRGIYNGKIINLQGNS